MKTHMFEDIQEPTDIKHGVDGVGEYIIWFVEVEFETEEDDDTIGYVPCGNGQVFHPGGGVQEVIEDGTLYVTGICFGDADGDHVYDWVDGKFEDAPSPMPLSEDQINKIRDVAFRYAEANVSDIELF